ncbi:MAG TPA: peptide deformylase [Candidatus Hydrogenedentes bacterium]|jgi:peptide deformylase|nr:peptide deformylase [FCB group bacterium]HNV22549.1 peptide deformylase [Candidatus Hydrogenedentota bacterium]HNZ17926.1 peptide deformylase [Candidatus Hydrogenedentota bacterium]HOH33567.1 peptide deformylase [Candidatus Hydrogenedentota bacterium]HPA06335.1 peptide deformylase [Candidatus Hydrogenedentota bacterium]
MNIVLYPDDPLQRVATPVEHFGPQLEKLAATMLETMYEHEGVGLAAPQVGIAKRFLVCHDLESDPLCLVNPEILEMDGAEVADEGCLSIPRIYAPVQRAERIHVRAKDPLGNDLDFEAHGFLARIIQHETDHLDGRVFLDRVDILTRQSKLAEWEELRPSLESAAPLG